MDLSKYGRCTRCGKTRPLNEVRLCVHCAEAVLHAPTHKYCPRCQTEKPLSQFSNPQKSYCRPCMAAYMREYSAGKPTDDSLLNARRAKKEQTRRIIAEFRQSLERKGGNS